jgi:hypothetical protein
MSSHRANRFRPGVESLEGRLLPSFGFMDVLNALAPLPPSWFGINSHSQQAAAPRHRKAKAAPRPHRRHKPAPLVLAATLPPASLANAMASAAPAPATTTVPGPAVVQFALSQVGTQVGDGQCATLAIQALQAAGAKTTLDYGVSGPDADYVWGTLVTSYADVQPGDVIQYRNVRIVETTRTPAGITTHTTTFAHHTSIVAQNLGGGRFLVLEQNVGPKGTVGQTSQVVQENRLNLAAATGGQVWIYHPQPLA